ARYAVHIDEVHHVHKLDAPSGTAITLARDIDMKTQRYSGFELHQQGTQPQNASPAPVPINSERVGEVPGKHSVTWAGANDHIVITHEAFNRNGFALGAVIAAEWLAGRKGFFTMDDVLEG
ncbi:MAG TPA: dihydrodipicolinate reductase C-terminal domain-containing protein, partial [Flavobacteriales bacterium]|nr:dihydrodipicolinate reductase C-terminal domain-containing protein [Flavobacteriales bacterium]